MSYSPMWVPHTWKKVRLPLTLVLLTGLGLSVVGCETIGYYSQAVSGQLSIFKAQQPIVELLKDSELDPALKQRLELVQQVREYASRELALPVGDNFSSYADLQRPYVVWNVVAAPPYSLNPQRWCFPVAGCVSYRGYFAETEAREYAAALKAEGNDVYVGAVPAYSTLGWFDDPVLNTFINRPEIDLVGLLFHELAHRVLYIAGDTTFNESFATAVELEGIKRWLADRNQSELFARYQLGKQRREIFTELVSELKAELRTLYQHQSTTPEAELANGKQRAIEAFRIRYAERAQSWQGGPRYDNWVNGEVNNAKLASVGAYSDLVPAFALLIEQAENLSTFYRWCEEFEKADQRSRHQAVRNRAGLE